MIIAVQKVVRKSFFIQHQLLIGAKSLGATNSAGFASSKKSVGHFQPKFPRPLKCKKDNGIDVLHDPLWSKSTAFTHSERDRLGLRGLLPPAVRNLEGQVERVVGHIRELQTDVAKNLYLQEVHNRNETLYHRILVEYMEEMAPLVYTPTVGVVCQQFGHRFTRARGMYFSAADRGQFSSMVYNWPHDNVHVIVVTDGSRILGLGDLGVHGMGIPIGKLALYCAAGGIAPHRVLPVQLDVGTDNEALRNDPNYIGCNVPRLQGEEYFDMLDEFMSAVYARWPGVVVQFEDFETSKAVPLLEKYREKYRCFNDDIQGTGCVTLAGIISAANQMNMKLTDMRFMCAGAGSAGLGVCTQLVAGMVQAGLSREEAMSRFVVCSIDGAMGAKTGKNGDPHYKKNLTAENGALWMNNAVDDGSSLLDVMKEFKPHVLLGLSTAPGIFNEELIKTMASQVERPVILPMSNPTSRAECTPEQAYTWTDGRAIVATGSPFAPVTLEDGSVRITSQCNNMYIFPGLGLGVSVAGIERVTDAQLYAASLAAANALNDEERAEGRTFPKIDRIRDVSHAVAVAVIKQGMEEKQAQRILPKHLKEGIESLVTRKMYFPEYVPILP